MSPTIGIVLAASTVKSIGVVIAVITVIGFLVYAVVNIRAGREEVGAEIEIAPNRKAYHDDDALEGPRLERALSLGLVLLAVVGVGLPLYWLNEPGRQEGAVEEFDRVFASRGADLFATTAEGGFDCAGCHGPEGVGGVADYTLMDDEGDFVATVTWKAPALDTVLLRYSVEEVRDILVYGRPFSPMPAWGEAGGGPLTEQQIDELIAYMQSIQLSPEATRAQVEDALRTELDLADDAPIDYADPAVGEALFNLGDTSGVAGGAYACARCHTRGWSIDDENNVRPENADLSPYVDYPDGSGAFGPSLRNGVVPRQFLVLSELADFLTMGTEEGMPYGRNGQGSGRMPGFGDNPNTDDEADGMFSEEMVEAVARYVAGLPESGPGTDAGTDAGTDTEEQQ